MQISSANIAAPRRTERRNAPISMPTAIPKQTEPSSSQLTDSTRSVTSTPVPIAAPATAAVIA
jgi:hypothetical protein